MRRRSTAQRRASRRRTEAGFGLAVLMVVLCVMTIWLTNGALCAGYGIIAASTARDRLAARMAAVERASRELPDEAGGSVFPDAAIDGFADYLVCNRTTGALEVVALDALPRSGVVVLRQWRLSPNGEDGRLFEVSTVLLDGATFEPRPGPTGAEFRFSQIVE